MEQACCESCSVEDAAVCWVCLLGDEEEALETPCQCSNRPVHIKCLARWQLQSAGRAEERTCRFCNCELPDWRPALTPANLPTATPVVSVHYNGTIYRIKVKPGADGFAQFQRQLHKITGLPMLDCMQITFQCRAPDTSQELSFKGITAFDAAIHCAAVSAAERLTQQRAAAAANNNNNASARRSADCTRAASTPQRSSNNGSTSSSTSGRHRTGGLARGASLDSARPPVDRSSALHQQHQQQRHPDLRSVVEGGASRGPADQAAEEYECDVYEEASGGNHSPIGRKVSGHMARMRDLFKRLLTVSS